MWTTKVIYNGSVPIKGTEYSDFDLIAQSVKKIREDFYEVTCGKLQPISTDFRILILPRSSISNTKWILHNSIGNIDPDYSGEIKVKFSCIPIITKKRFLFGLFYRYEISYEEFPYNVGDRVAQFFLSEKHPTELVLGELKQYQRGNGGFGSTGKN